jgi:DNA-binding response OmpR family regulator
MKRILVIDDDEGLRRMLQMSLEEAGYAVTGAEDGKLGMECLSRTPVDLVITDLVMPNKEGLETILEMRKAQPHLKIIAMSGGSRTSPRDNLAMAKNFGAAFVFHKPFSLAEMTKAVADLVGAATPGPPERVFEPE